MLMVDLVLDYHNSDYPNYSQPEIIVNRCNVRFAAIFSYT